MNGVATLAALGASAVLALVVLRSKPPAFREAWESKNGRIESLARLPTSGQVVPFRLIKENPVLPIMLDGDDHLTCWIVDSGYGYTAVDSSLARRLNLPATGSMDVQTLRTDSLTTTKLPSGFVFDMTTGQPVVEIPAHSAVIRSLPGTLDDTYGYGTDCLKQGGILGITFLRHFVTRLDYKNQTLTFYDPGRFRYPSRGKGMKFTGWLENEHYFLIPMEIDGVPAEMALDTGAFATIMTKGFMNKYKRAKGKNLDAEGVDGSVEASFSENNITLKKKVVPRVSVGDHLLRRLEILFPDCNDSRVCPGLLATRRFDGLLGYSVLKDFVIYMVYEPTPYVILEPNA
uniref:Peptidase A2 domain-containing protein n=1 Tax=viral metagenome TaxID=1070528 RepID=A0A6C0BLL3_9ZZZZ